MTCPYAPKRRKAGCKNFDSESPTCKHSIDWSHCGIYKRKEAGEQ